MRARKPVLQNNISALRKARNLSMEALGAMIETDASTINKLEKGKTRLDAERLKRIADALNVDPTAIIATEDEPPMANKDEKLLAFERSLDELSSALAAAGRPMARRKLPVIGSAAGSVMQGTFQLTNEPVDYIDLPPALEATKGIYAIYVIGSSMEPMFRDGSICGVSEFRPPRLGDAVVMQEKKGQNAKPEASIGILESRSSGKISLRKLNPPAVVDLKPEYVVSIHKVLDFNDLLGV